VGSPPGPDHALPALEETLLWLCGIASPTGEEKALCDVVAERLARLSPASPVRRHGDSLVVPLVRGAPSTPPRPHVALVGHLDTVRTENGPARREGDRVFGAGAADMKSGLAVMMVLGETVPRDLACDLTLVFYAREEGSYRDNELGRVLDDDPDLSRVDLAVCLEPSDNRLQLGCCGSIQATISFEGRTSHSARPWEGENAITKAAGFLGRLAALSPVSHEIDGLVFRSAFTVTLASGGRGRNVVPDLFTLNLNHRFAPTTSLERAQEDVLALVAGEARVDFTDLAPGALPSAQSPLVSQLMTCGVTAVEPKQAWTDVARFSSLGVAAVNFGPGESAQAHQKNESTSLDKVVEGYRILERWLQKPIA